MLKDIKLLLGDGRKFLRMPIALLILDSIFATMFFAVLCKVLLDIVNNIFSMKALFVYSIILICTFIFRCVTLSLASTNFHIRGSKLIRDLRIDLGDHIRKLNLGFFNRNSIGNLTNIMTEDIQNFEETITHIIGDLIKVIVLSTFMLLVSFFIDAYIASIQLLVVLISLPLFYSAGAVIHRLGKRKRIVVNDVISRIVEYIDGVRVFKSFNIAGKKFNRLESSFAALKKESILGEIGAAPFNVLYMIVVKCMFPIVLLFATLRFMDGLITPANFITMTIISLSLSNVLANFSAQYSVLKHFSVATANLVNTYQQEPVSYKYRDVRFENYDIEFKNVDFSYEKDVSIFRNINFMAKEGELTALVGFSGSGKTTVTSLIARFWDPVSGVITIGGHDISEIEPDFLLEHISIVFQDVYLLNDTVYENIKVGDQNATTEQIIAAARIANCHDFILKLENGYEAIVGEGGSTLSGGEKQRISIARAILKDASIILLDEATASLDADNEAEIRESIAKLVKDKTVIVIAHRLNTIKDADNIIVLNNGIVEEMGTHEQLILNNSVYAKMFSILEKYKKWKL